MPKKRAILYELTADELRANVEYYELVVDDRRVKAELVEALAGSRKARLGEILPLLLPRPPEGIVRGVRPRPVRTEGGSRRSPPQTPRALQERGRNRSGAGGPLAPRAIEEGSRD